VSTLCDNRVRDFLDDQGIALIGFGALSQWQALEPESVNVRPLSGTNRQS
jgi:hypothetical protein